LYEEYIDINEHYFVREPYLKEQNHSEGPVVKRRKKRSIKIHFPKLVPSEAPHGGRGGMGGW
jgi:hypothetical protein